MHALVKENDAAVAALCRKYSVAEFDVFGSVTREDFDAARSDLDFLVRFLPSTRHQHRLNYFGLLAELESLFDRSVDLVEIDAVSNPYVLSDIQATRKKLYAA